MPIISELDNDIKMIWDFFMFIIQLFLALEQKLGLYHIYTWNFLENIVIIINNIF